MEIAALEPAASRGGAEGSAAAAAESALPGVNRANASIAAKLRQAADILSAQAADPFRVRAYRNAAEAILAMPEELGLVAERGGRNAIEAIPGIGTSIASAIAEMLATGR